MGISISITDDRIEQIDSFIDKGFSRDRSAFITQSVDLMFKSYSQKFIIDFMYFVSIPFLFFLITVGLTLLLASMFFYLLSGIGGIYLIVFFYLFYDKYRGVKWLKK